MGYLVRVDYVDTCNRINYSHLVLPACVHGCYRYLSIYLKRSVCFVRCIAFVIADVFKDMK